tara:strand:- start:3890 stop:6262 length:2373 start_codon:yes stop_codon:yes gene_type:complete
MKKVVNEELRERSAVGRELIEREEAVEFAEQVRAASLAPRSEPQYTPLPVINAGLTRQPWSSTAWAAQHCRFKLEDIPLPDELKALTRKRAAPGDEPKQEHKIAFADQTGIVQDAFYQLRTCQLAYNEDETTLLMNAEVAELEASAGMQACHPDSALPRKYALTALVRDVNKAPESTRFLLHAMAHIASFEGEDAKGNRKQRAAKDVRLMMLTGQNACRYAARRVVPLHEDEDIALVLVRVDMDVAEDGTPHRWLKAHKVPMQALDAGRKMYCETLRAAAMLFQQAGLLSELPPTLCKTYEVRSRELESAYEDSVMSANEAFWAQLVRVDTTEARADYKLCGRHIMTYLKIGAKCMVDDPNKAGLAHENVFIGALQHKKGMEDAAKKYVDTANDEELRQKLAESPGRNPEDVPVGLRVPDGNVRDQNLGFHIFQMEWEWVSFKHQVSSYGRYCAPGQMVSTQADGMVPRLVYKLMPFDHAHYKDYYVLTCPPFQTLPVDERYGETMWDAFEQGISMCFDRYCDKPCVMTPVPRPLKALKPTDPPSAEDETLSRMGGMPMCGAFRIGDVLERMSAFPLPAYKAFVASGLKRLGPCKSMVDLYTDCTTMHETIARLEAEKRQLEQTLADAKAAVPRPGPPPPPDPSFLPTIKIAISAMALVRRGSVTFKGREDYANIAKLIGRCQGNADDVELDANELERVHALGDISADSHALDHLAAVARCYCASSQPSLLAIVQIDNQKAKVMLCSAGKTKWKQVTLERAMDLHRNACCFQYLEKTKRLIAFEVRPPSE